MKKTAKIIICSILCTVMLISGASSVFAKVEPRACRHEHTSIAWDVFVRYAGYNGYNGHWEEWTRKYVCDACGQKVGDAVSATLFTGHNYQGNPYDNLGHSGSSHMYRIRCACGYSQVITIPCEGGSHNTPW